MTTQNISRATANVQLLKDYFASWAGGGDEGIAGIESFYAPDIKVWAAGNSSVSGEFAGLEDFHERYFMRIQEMTNGHQQLVGKPVILAAGDRFVMTIVFESHHREGKEPMVFEKFVLYELKDGKITGIRGYEFDQDLWDSYYA